MDMEVQKKKVERTRQTELIEPFGPVVMLSL